MKILQVGASWFSHQFSGLERYYSELVTRLPALGLQVTGCIYELKDPSSIEGLDLVSFGTQDSNLARKFLGQRRILKPYFNNGLDLVVSHCTPSLFPSLGDLGHKPLICHFHGPRYLERAVEGANTLSVQLSKYIEHKVYGRADHFITLSHYMKHLLVETYSVPEEKISVVPGGVDLERFTASLTQDNARAQLGLPTNKPIILTVRRLVRRMGLHNLVEAMSEVVRLKPEVLLLIAGQGTLEDQLKALIHAKGLSNHIRIMGAVDDQVLPCLYRAADFSIVPTISYEGFGLILVESLGCGTPVLGTPVGAIPEVLRPLSQSLLLESAAPKHLAEGIVEVLLGKRLLPSMEECRRYAAQNYAWPIIVSRINAVYQNTVNTYLPAE